VLRLTPQELLNNKGAQQTVFDYATKMRDTQRVFAQDLLERLKIDGEVTSILKRETLEEFVDGVINKTTRNGYDYIGQMDDMSRGRFDLKSWQDVDHVFQFLKEQTAHKVTNVELPRRPVSLEDGTGYGYPRFHVVVQDPKTLITHEWQIGTKATSQIFETPGIKIPNELELNPRMHTDLHDIEYDIFRAIQAEHPEIAQEYRIPDFRAQLDQFAAESGRSGAQTPNLEVRIDEFLVRAAEILQDLMNGPGPEFIKQFYH